MEVHAHSHLASGETHTARKKWTHYFWEFLMLFLAVFAGFLAEYQLEHKIEKDRAGELAKSFYEELKNDSVLISTSIKNRLRRDEALVYLKNFYQDSSLSNVSKTFAVNFFYTYETFNLSIFEPNDAILQQLRNSGSLRYFKNFELQKLASNLSVRISYIRTRNQIEWTFYNERLIPFAVSHNDQTFFDQLSSDSKVWIIDALQRFEKSNEQIPFHFQKPATFDRIEAVNNIGYYQLATRSTTRKAYPDYVELNHQLLEVLRKEYHLK